MPKLPSNLTFEIDTDNPYSRIMRRAQELLDLHGLTEKGWTFDFTSAKVSLGRCEYKRKRITFSEYYVNIEWAEIEDTLLHEIAHALTDTAFPNAQAHGLQWQHTAARIGARPERCAPIHVESSAQYNYYMECPDCGRRWYRYRMRRRNFDSYCPDCKATLKIYKIKKGG